MARKGPSADAAGDTGEKHEGELRLQREKPAGGERPSLADAHVRATGDTAVFINNSTSVLNNINLTICACFTLALYALKYEICTMRWSKWLPVAVHQGCCGEVAKSRRRLPPPAGDPSGRPSGRAPASHQRAREAAGDGQSQGKLHSPNAL